MKTTAKLWVGVVVLIIISPLGLILPERFKAGSAWGEWRADEMQKLVGYIPKGLAKLSSLWNAPLPDYAFKGREQSGLSHLSLAYIICAVLGIIIIVIVMLLIGKMSVKKPKF